MRWISKSQLAKKLLWSEAVDVENLPSLICCSDSTIRTVGLFCLTRVQSSFTTLRNYVDQLVSWCKSLSCGIKPSSRMFCTESQTPQIWKSAKPVNWRMLLHSSSQTLKNWTRRKESRNQKNNLKSALKNSHLVSRSYLNLRTMKLCALFWLNCFKKLTKRLWPWSATKWTTLSSSSGRAASKLDASGMTWSSLMKRDVRARSTATSALKSSSTTSLAEILNNLFTKAITRFVELRAASYQVVKSKELRLLELWLRTQRSWSWMKLLLHLTRAAKRLCNRLLIEPWKVALQLSLLTDCRRSETARLFSFLKEEKWLSKVVSTSLRLILTPNSKS